MGVNPHRNNVKVRCNNCKQVFAFNDSSATDRRQRTIVLSGDTKSSLIASRWSTQCSRSPR